MLKKLSILLFPFILTACGTYGASYPKPSYNYLAKTGDPQLFFESDFGTNTNFSAKLNAVGADALCGSGAKGVAYKQEMDSYFRNANAPGPWKIYAPAGVPIRLTGSWSTYGSTSSSTMNGLKTTVTTLNRSCQFVAKVFVPKSDEKYMVRLTNGGSGVCSMAITTTDGSAVDLVDAPQCKD
jgi:hypothetical protein